MSRYSEDTGWLMEAPFASHAQVVYNKGTSPLSTAAAAAGQGSSKVRSSTAPPPSFREESLPNVGREGHTFLHHILTHYDSDSLADVTVFLPASCTDPHKISKTKRVIQLAVSTQSSVFIGQRFRDVRKELWNFGPEKWGGTNESNRSTMEVSDRMMVLSDLRPFGNWYEHHFGMTKVKVVSWMGIFAVSRLHVHQHPRSHYEALLNTVGECINPQVHLHSITGQAHPIRLHIMSHS